MRKVKVIRYGITHYMATCFGIGCNFQEEDHANTQRIRSLVRKHVLETGHIVSIEKAISTHYTLDGDK